MAYTVSAAFSTFFDNINLAGDHHVIATARRDRIVSLLEKTFTINEAFSTGSIPRYTAVTTHADLDVMVALHYGKHINGKKPSEVLAEVQKALSGYVTRVRRNGQAVTLTYESWPDVDIVPVAKLETSGAATYQVPNMNREEWIVSKPTIHDANLLSRNKTFGQEFKKIIKMMKWWNHQHSELMQSYHIEVLAYQVLTSSFTDYPWNVFSCLKDAAELAKSPLYYEGDFADKYLFDQVDARNEVVKRLSKACDKARAAWYATYGGKSDDKTAIEIWRQIFGDKFPAYG
jgi:hypothetical protein